MFGGAVTVPDLRNSDLALALNYVPVAARDHVCALWMLDETLGRVVQTTTEAMIGQMRLTWWHERLCAIDAGAVAAEPVLSACAALCGATAVTGAALAQLVEGWEVLFEPMPLGAETIATHARMRGGVLFEFAAQILGQAGDVQAAGEGWAAMDFAAHCSHAETAALAQLWARERLAAVRDPDVRALRILTRLARADCRRPLAVPRSRFAVLRAILF